MKNVHLLLACLLVPTLQMSCVPSEPSAKSLVVDTAPRVAGTLPHYGSVNHPSRTGSDQATIATEHGSQRRDAMKLQYETEIEKAAAKRSSAQDRCFGMVGAAKRTCFNDAEDFYQALIRVADRRMMTAEIAPSSLR